MIDLAARRWPRRVVRHRDDSSGPITDASGHRANTIAYVGTIGGTVLVATGAALSWWGYTQGRTERVSVAPVVTDRLAGLVVTGSWR